MSKDKGYLEYTSNTETMASYFQTQQKYFEEPRESDKFLMDLIAKELDLRGKGNSADLLDAGCSVSSFLYHLKTRFPGMGLTGIDITPDAVSKNRANPAFEGISFLEKDMTALAFDREFDLVVCNRSMMFFAPETFAAVFKEIFRALTPGGLWLMLDFITPWEQDLEVRETSAWYPDGLTLYMRSQAAVNRAAEAAGFSSVDYRPFDIAIDLPANEDPSQLFTYTVATAEQARLQFRGTLHQPWTAALLRRPA